ncbi:phosphoserine phosphatase SerB [archaeon]|nr:MAG: phosphoserine phosphatase SerB [archaeon]
MSDSTTREELFKTLRSAQAYCFDVDSTVIAEEGIDQLADFKGVGKAVSEMTAQAMGGSMLFEDALAARLDIIRPSRQDVHKFLSDRPFHLTQGIEEVVSLLHRQNKVVYLVSGGFRQMIEPVADKLLIPSHRIYANNLLFDSAGAFKGFDEQEFTCRDGGKRRAVEHLASAFGYSNIVMVGDGVTDMQAKPPAKIFVGFGGVVVREKVEQGADWFIKDFKNLLEVLKDTNSN